MTRHGDGAAASVASGLVARLPRAGERLSPDEILDRFLSWTAEVGFELYPAQEEALLELMAGRHLVLNTPTGSGKSLVALGLHFKTLCEGARCFYTSPIKALASEKFFSLCDDLGAERVGMLTGDASLNPEAPIVCCTAEVLANMALRRGGNLGVDYVVMDEFHYYGDKERGVWWQVPLISMPETTFLLMSATLGNTAPITERLERATGRPVATVTSANRPVPLDWEYLERPLHETVDYLLETGRAPIYVVSFTQRECAELAQSLTSMQLCTRPEREAIREAVGSFRFDTPYGKEIRRFLQFGVAVHHAGLLPKYRLLVEQLSQQGLLKAICGTDTLGVGVNIPIRTVAFTKLCKYDGEKVAILAVRDFQQISGRAGRKGFDDRGSVVCLAPDHVIENRRLEAKAAADPKKRRKLVKKQPPQFGFVPWDEKTFERLIGSPPEMLQSRFRITHGMVLQSLQRDADDNDPARGNFATLRALIDRCHEDDARKRQLLGEAAMLVRSLGRAGIVRMVRDTETDYLWVTVNEELQFDFSMHQALSLFLVETIKELEEGESYALDLLSLTESILENPTVVLRRQVDRAKGDVVARLKAEGVPYEERMERLEEVTYPKPNAEQLYAAFDRFREAHPWVIGEGIRPKSIAREMVEEYWGFSDYVRRYGLQRSEGVLLRYLSQAYKTLTQSVPDPDKTDEVYDVLGFLRAVIERTDTSLLEEWESMLHPELALAQEEARERAREELRIYELFHDPRAFAARVRAELHQLVRALAHGDWEEAVASVRPPSGDGQPWDEDRFQEALAPFFTRYQEIVFTPEARQSRLTQVEQTAPRLWEVSQVLLDPDGDNQWHVRCVVDLRSGQIPEGPLVEVEHIGE